GSTAPSAAARPSREPASRGSSPCSGASGSSSWSRAVCCSPRSPSGPPPPSRTLDDATRRPFPRIAAATLRLPWAYPTGSWPRKRINLGRVTLPVRNMEPSVVQRGLEDVVALESRICFIDGKQGRLIYRGYDIRELTARSTFEEVAYLLWYSRLPTATQLAELKRRMAELRTIPDSLAKVIDSLPADASPMDMLRTAVSALALFEPQE